MSVSIDQTKTGAEIAVKVGFTPKLTPIENFPEDPQIKFLEADEVEEYCK